MNQAAAVFARWLRQTSQLGGPDLYLARLSPEQAYTAARALSGARPPRPTRTRAIARTTVPAPAATVAPMSGELRVLAEQAAVCTRCRLHDTRMQAVFGVGDPSADLVVVGEAPGAEEDRTGHPFVGRAGRLLDLLLLSAGFPRESVYICNLLKCRPPQNRDPQPDEVDACTSAFLVSQIEAIAPRVLLAVGRHSAQYLSGTNAPIGRLRGTVRNWRGIPVVAIYHPAYLLRSPEKMRTAWGDLQLARRILDE